MSLKKLTHRTVFFDFYVPLDEEEVKDAFGAFPLSQK